MDNNTIIIAIIATFVLILVGIISFLFVKLKSNKNKIEHEPTNIFDDEEPVAENTSSGQGNDVISQVAELLAEGHESKAVALLNSGITKYPQNNKLHLMLLNIYAKNNDSNNFEKVVDLLHTNGDVQAIAKANKLREKLKTTAEELPVEDLRQKSQQVASSQAVSPSNSDDLNIDLDDDLDLDLAIESAVPQNQPVSNDNDSMGILSTLDDSSSIQNPVSQPNNAEHDLDFSQSFDSDMSQIDSALNDDLSISQQLSAIESTIVNTKAVDDSMLATNEAQVPALQPAASQPVVEDDFFSLDLNDNPNTAQPKAQNDSNGLDFSFDLADANLPNQNIDQTSSLAEIEKTLSNTMALNLNQIDTAATQNNVPVTNNQVETLQVSQPSIPANSNEMSLDLDFDLNTEAPIVATNQATQPLTDNDLSFDLELTTDNAVQPTNQNDLNIQNSVAEPVLQTADVNTQTNEITFDLELDSLATDSAPAVTSQAPNEELSFDLSLETDLTTEQQTPAVNSAPSPSELSLSLDSNNVNNNVVSSEKLVTELTLSGDTENLKDKSLQLDGLNLNDIQNNAVNLTANETASNTPDLGSFDFGDIEMTKAQPAVSLEPEAVIPQPTNNLEVANATQATPSNVVNELNDFNFNDDSANNTAQPNVAEPVVTATQTLEINTPPTPTNIESPVALPIQPVNQQDADLLSRLQGELAQVNNANIHATNLDLANTYIEIGETAGAKNLIAEVMASGSDVEKQQAQQLLQKISS